MWIGVDGGASASRPNPPQADEQAQHARPYGSVSRRQATPPSGARILEMGSHLLEALKLFKAVSLFSAYRIEF